MIDCLLNAMINPAFLLAAGGLAGWTELAQSPATLGQQPASQQGGAAHKGVAGSAERLNPVGDTAVPGKKPAPSAPRLDPD
jgi:hypothetical protein